MIEVEYRARIAVPDLPAEDEQRWGGLIEHLEAHFGRFGPVLSWQHGSALVVMSTQASDKSSAARSLFDAVAESLNAVGLVDLYPTSVEVEIPDDRLAPV